MSSEQQHELEQLRRENRTLNDQVKRLVRAERRLALSRQVLDGQLRNLEGLNRFALLASHAERVEDIVRLALELIIGVFPFELGLGFIRTADRAYALTAVRALPGLEPAGGGEESLTVRPRAELPAVARIADVDALCRDEPGAVEFARAFEWVFGVEASNGRASTPALLLPIGLIDGPLYAVLLVVRRAASDVSLLDPLPSASDLPYLSLVAAHAASAMRNLISLRDAREAVRARDDFLSVASHELRTPLTALSLQVQALSRMRGNDDAARRALAAVDRQTRRLSTLVEQLLDVSRIRVGRMDLERTEIDVAALVHDTVARLEPLAARAGSAIRVRAPRSLVAFVDRSQLDQVVTNLLTNAIKFGRGGPIDVRLEPAEGRFTLQVEDWGMGIAESEQARVFNRFERAVSSNNFGGLGLGLYISRKVVEAHGGTISVKSRLGAGTTFTAQMPLGTGAAAAARHESAAAYDGLI